MNAKSPVRPSIAAAVLVMAAALLIGVGAATASRGFAVGAAASAAAAPGVGAPATAAGETSTKTAPETAAARAPKDLALLLPAAGEVGGWTAEGEPSRYDAESLWEYIDGSADKFLVYGFQRVLVQDYVSGAHGELKVEIYEHESPLYAFGIYSQLRSPGLAAYEIGAEAFGDEYSINFRKDRYYVRVSIFEKSAELLTAARSFAGAIAGRIGEGGALPPEIGVLPERGLVREETTFIPQGALGREKFPPALAASYRLGDEKGTLYLSTLPDSAAARAVFDWYARESGAAVTPTAMLVEGSTAGAPYLLGAGKDPYRGDVLAFHYRRWFGVVTGFAGGTDRARTLAFRMVAALYYLE